MNKSILLLKSNYRYCRSTMWATWICTVISEVIVSSFQSLVNVKLSPVTKSESPYFFFPAKIMSKSLQSGLAKWICVKTDKSCLNNAIFQGGFQAYIVNVWSLLHHCTFLHWFPRQLSIYSLTKIKPSASKG